MDSDILEALRELMEPELNGIQRQGGGLYVTQERRYGRLVLRFDFDPSAESLRMYTTVPPPPGAGPEFLVSGHAYTRHQQDKTQCAVSVQVHGRRKTLHVSGDRFWVDARPSAPHAGSNPHRCRRCLRSASRTLPA